MSVESEERVVQRHSGAAGGVVDLQLSAAETEIQVS